MWKQVSRHLLEDVGNLMTFVLSDMGNIYHQKRCEEHGRCMFTLSINSLDFDNSFYLRQQLEDLGNTSINN